MAGELQVPWITGRTVYFHVRTATGTIWNGSSFVTYATADIANYKIAATEQGTASAYFTATMPAAAAGYYNVVAYQQTGGSAAEGDYLIGGGMVEWDGSAVVPLSSRLAPTTSGRTLDVSAGGEAGVDWANVGGPTTTVALTGTTIADTQKVDVNTIKTQAVTCAAGVTVRADVGAAAAPGAANGMLIGGSNAATTFAGLTTGALSCTTITASGAVAFQSTFAVTTSTSLAALSATTVTFSGAVAFQSTFAVTTSTSLAALSCTTLTASGAVAFQSTFAVTTSTSLAALSCSTFTASSTVTFSAFTVTNDLRVLGSLLIDGNFTVTGPTSLAAVATSGTVTLNALTVTNATTLSGAVSLGSTLGVTGTVTFNAFTVTNAFTVSGATTLTGAVTGTNASNDLRVNVTKIEGSDATDQIRDSILNDATRFAGADVAAIKAKTDNLPSDPADESLIIAATDAIMTRLGVPVSTVSADIAAVQADTDNIQTRLPAALVGGRMDSSTGAFTAAALAQFFTLDTTKVFADAVSGSVVKEITVGSGGPLTVAGIVTGVWTALLASSDFSTAASIGKLLKDDIDDAVSSRMAAYVQPTGFLAATFPTDVAGLSALAVAHGAGSWATATGFAVAGDAMTLMVGAINAVADQVWDEALADHLNVGSTGFALNGAGATGDPWVSIIDGVTAGSIMADLLAMASGKIVESPADVFAYMGRDDVTPRFTLTVSTGTRTRS